MAGKLRCAIYTRKSSEEGLEQDFNSLHAQREAGEAYVRSQVGEGWTVLPKAYDDGGFSGGSMDRPGLKGLLDDIGRGLVDVVVVYKVDRLTRSLTDFAKIVEQFDARGVSFVSVTQAFNTTTSMGRLTLNVLLSFAQFEREVTGERIRDKIAASKAKGMWMGGMPPLGYDFKDRKLLINEAEAATVRRIFERYLELGSASALVAELDRDDVRSKAWVTRAGKAKGGSILERAALFHILKARVYVGEIVHGDKAFAGQHNAIIGRELFGAVQEKLAGNTVSSAARSTRASESILTGLIFDHDGKPFGPSFGYGKQGKLYRYYIAGDLQVGRQTQWADDAVRRISAPAIEKHLLDQLRRLSGRAALSVSDLATVLTRVELRPTESHIIVRLDELMPAQHYEMTRRAIAARLVDDEFLSVESSGDLRIVMPSRMQLRGGRSSVSGVGGSKSRTNISLVRTLRRAHADLEALKSGPLTPPELLAEATAPETQYERQVARLAYLSPRVQSAVLNGSVGGDVDLLVALKTPMPLDWASQEAWLAGLKGQRRFP